jgi:mannose-6-phosphate isomerase
MLGQYHDWLVGTALPFWAESGFDPDGGRFHERLDHAGQPLRVPLRAMVQARQIFVYAEAARLGWLPEGARLAEIAFASLLRDFVTDDGEEASVAFSIDPVQGHVVSPIRDAYAHAFLLLAIAALHRLNGDPGLLDLADRLLRFISLRLTDPEHGGMFDALPVSGGKRQNPHMHLLEALLFLERTAPGHGYIDRAAGLVDLSERHFCSGGVLIEYFDPDWSPATPVLWEPGHHFEWVWLLDEYGRRTGHDLTCRADGLFEVALEQGLAPDGSIVDALAPDGIMLKPSRRLWPHTEAIKAAAARHRRGDLAAQRFAEAMARRLMHLFVGRPIAGGWIDHISADGVPLVDHMPASSLYHLLLAGQVAAKGFASAPALAKAAP